MRRLAIFAALFAVGCDDGGVAEPDAGATTDARVLIDGGDGCGLAGAETGGLERTVKVRGRTRSYILAVPDDYDSGRSHALVFGWHGFGSTGVQARTYFGIEEASAGDALVVYADGEEQPLGATQHWDLTVDGPDVELFDVLLETIASEYCIDRERVFATGHSNGGYFSNVLGCARGGVVKAIAPVAGGGPFGDCPGEPPAAWLVHGTEDSVVPFSMGQGSHLYWRDENGCSETVEPVDPDPCVAHVGCTGRPVVWCAHGETTFSGHGWPSFVPDGMWAFFESL